MSPQESHSRRTLTIMEGREENSHLVEGFAAAAKAKGWDFCHLKGINSDKIARFDFEDIPLDYVVFRELSKNNYYEVERVMEWLAAHHKTGINLRVSGGRTSTSDKHYQQGLFMLDPHLRPHALPTFEAKTKANVLSYEEAGRVHYPFILKPRRGTTGDDITLIRKESDLDKIESFRDLLIEQYIKPECDFRVFVIGGTAVGTMRKIGDPARPGNFKIWCAGQEKHLEDDPVTLDALSEIATRAAAISKLEYAGIDILREEGTGKYYILETNIAAGWSNFLPVTHINIPAIALDWIDERADKSPVPVLVNKYISNRKSYLPTQIRKDYDSIINGEKGITSAYRKAFSYYPSRYICDAGRIFDELSRAYEDVVENPSHRENYANLIQEVERMPLSWAGNFIGPEVGTLHDGAILSALYLYLLGKSSEV